MKRLHLFTILAQIVLVACFGCAEKQRPVGLPKLYQCDISITQQDAPLEGATVMLIAPSCTWSVGGRTDAHGVAKIYTHGEFVGAPEGDFKVVVSKNVIENPPSPEQLANPSFSGSSGTPIEMVSANFRSATTTPLTLKVSGKTAQSFDVGKRQREVIKRL